MILCDIIVVPSDLYKSYHDTITENETLLREQL